MSTIVKVDYPDQVYDVIDKMLEENNYSSYSIGPLYTTISSEYNFPRIVTRYNVLFYDNENNVVEVLDVEINNF